METMASLPRRVTGEAVGAAFLLLAIVGSGIAADRLTDDAALTLLINAIVTGAALTAVITAVGPISGAHLNPAVTLAIAMERGLPWRDVPFYVARRSLARSSASSGRTSCSTCLPSTSRRPAALASVCGSENSSPRSAC
ncbi:MAG: aquaporin [Candidatus Limnocylindria bacterium]